MLLIIMLDDTGDTGELQRFIPAPPLNHQQLQGRTARECFKSELYD